MKQMIRYPAHFKPIKFPPRKAEGPPSTQLNLASCHQSFIQLQTEMFHFFIEQQSALLKKFRNLAESPRAHAKNLVFSRADLEGLSSGKISDYFGEWFKPLDTHTRLIRMPEPPLLLADRVTAIDAEPGSLKTGTIKTETDVAEDAWYLHMGRMPAGIMIESGQADLLLASWLGFDFYNQGTRVYRLLGCELSYSGELPKPGDTLCYDIHIDGQAKQGDVRLFFFHYDCRINGELRLKVRHGQAGFFSDQELAESGGVLWDANTAGFDATLPLAPPLVSSSYARFNRQQIEQFSLGNLKNCFGKGFEMAAAHTRTPRISHGKMLFLHEITDFNVQGGPFGRGYMRARQNIQPDDWFFQGHFKNDPCMPGTLMLEAGLQVMAFYLTALGYTLDKDGWRFEPVSDRTYKLCCRGQVRPSAKEVIYEIFITSLIAGPRPMLFADLLGTVDGLKAFHTKIGLRLVPDWPLEKKALLPPDERSADYQGFHFDKPSLMACALGKPSDAFGPIYQVFDNHRRVPRLPGPPYHFMTRVMEVPAKMGVLEVGAEMQCEFEVEADAWYFLENQGAMPYCVLLEAALQPCGWLASYMGSVLQTEEDLVFRNLDGTGTVYGALLSKQSTLTTRVKCTAISRSGGMLIESFNVETKSGDQKIFAMDTTFGFFPLSAFANQPGLPIAPIDSQLIHAPSDFLVNLTAHPERFFNGTSPLPKGTLLMLDRVTGFWPLGGEKGLGQMRAEKTVNPSEWFFKAHFFQDPVQPGSLGLEALYQLLHCYALQSDIMKSADMNITRPASNVPLTWKYRGQVVPLNRLIQMTLEIVSIEQENAGFLIKANGSLWVDDIRIYAAKNLAVKISPPHEKLV